MAKNEQTGKKAGTAASKTLRDDRTAKASKTAAGSALSQRPDKKPHSKRANLTSGQADRAVKRYLESRPA